MPIMLNLLLGLISELQNRPTRENLQYYDMAYFVGVSYLYNFLENFLVVDPNLLGCRMNND